MRTTTRCRSRRRSQVIDSSPGGAAEAALRMSGPASGQRPRISSPLLHVDGIDPGSDGELDPLRREAVDFDIGRRRRDSARLRREQRRSSSAGVVPAADHVGFVPCGRHRGKTWVTFQVLNKTSSRPTSVACIGDDAAAAEGPSGGHLERCTGPTCTTGIRTEYVPGSSAPACPSSQIGPGERSPRMAAAVLGGCRRSALGVGGAGGRRPAGVDGRNLLTHASRDAPPRQPPRSRPSKLDMLGSLHGPMTTRCRVRWISRRTASNARSGSSVSPFGEEGAGSAVGIARRGHASRSWELVEVRASASRLARSAAVA